MPTPVDRTAYLLEHAAAPDRPLEDDPRDVAELAYRHRFPLIAELLDADPDVPDLPGPPL